MQTERPRTSSRMRTQHVRQTTRLLDIAQASFHLSWLPEQANVRLQLSQISEARSSQLASDEKVKKLELE